VASWKERDPLVTYRERLVAEGLLDAAAIEAIETEAESEVEAAVAFAEAGTWEPVEHLTRWVTSEPDEGVDR
jgi:TPP-dependent pyruvate/acetoin dehydrogenase alpha subunit